MLAMLPALAFAHHVGTPKVNRNRNALTARGRLQVGGMQWLAILAVAMASLGTVIASPSLDQDYMHATKPPVRPGKVEVGAPVTNSCMGHSQCATGTTAEYCNALHRCFPCMLCKVLRDALAGTAPCNQRCAVAMAMEATPATRPHTQTLDSSGSAVAGSPEAFDARGSLEAPAPVSVHVGATGVRTHVTVGSATAFDGTGTASDSSVALVAAALCERGTGCCDRHGACPSHEYCTEHHDCRACILCRDLNAVGQDNSVPDSAMTCLEKCTKDVHAHGRCMSHNDCDHGTAYCSHVNICLGCILCSWVRNELSGAGSCEGWCRVGLGEEISWVAALHAADPMGTEQELTPAKMIGRLAMQGIGLDGHTPRPSPSTDQIFPRPRDTPTVVIVSSTEFKSGGAGAGVGGHQNDG